MRVLVLTHDADRHLHFASALIEQTGAVVGVITGGKTVHRDGGETLRIRLMAARRHPRAFARQLLFNRLYRVHGPRLARDKEAAEQRHFEGSAERFRRRHGHLVLAAVTPQHGSINDDHFVRVIRDAAPDVIAVMGTALLRRAIIESAPIALNLHTGLSPYYRGGLTNFWPFIENDYGYFGVTVHKLSTGIDSGDIVNSDRVLLVPDDTFPEINCRAIERGIELMADTLQYIAVEGEVAGIPQWTKGKLFHARHYTHLAAARYYRRRSAFVAEHLRRQEAGLLDRVRRIRNGR